MFLTDKQINENLSEVESNIIMLVASIIINQYFFVVQQINYKLGG